MVEPMRMSPLADLARPDRAVDGPAPVSLQALPFQGKLILRAGVEAGAAAARALVFELPATLRSAGAGGIEALWLGPDEWLVLGSEDAVRRLAAELRAVLAQLHHAVVEVGDRLIGIAVRGGRAADVLAAGCPLDLHARVFPPGTATRTLFGKASIVLLRPVGRDGFELFVGVSFAPYVWSFLENAAREFGFAVTA
jgi:sarcosine oxidase subunit gamma